MTKNRKIGNVALKKNSKRLLLDVADIMKNPLTDQGIYYIHDENNMYNGTAMIIGPSKTPYENGYFFFKFKFPKMYPYKPPIVTYCTNDGKTRFNPNLYTCGKVCVSILNTWKGDQWTSCQTIKSILLTLVTLLNENPLINEPGFTTSHSYCKPYNRMIQYMNFKTAILGILKQKNMESIFMTYYPLILKHFKKHKDSILDHIEVLRTQHEIIGTKTDKISMYNMKITYDYNELKKDFEEFIKTLD